MSQIAGYSVADAAKVLGVSTRTIRRHLKEGKLPYTKIDGQFGEEYRITELPEVQKKAEPPVPSAELSGTVAFDIIRRLEEENRNLAGQLGVAQEKIRNLEGRLKLLAQPKITWWRRLFGKTY
ncbi:MAG: helix-turn-helix domain-containing protein [Dehalococcoidales bacterium]|nr:helix-turn-helix domain-containing protein [Dehalococcoidales bacterium]